MTVTTSHIPIHHTTTDDEDGRIDGTFADGYADDYYDRNEYLGHIEAEVSAFSILVIIFILNDIEYN